MDSSDRAARSGGAGSNPRNGDFCYNNNTMFQTTGSSSSGGRLESEIDGLLANAGYTVRASDLALLAERLEQLENAMGAVQDPGISHLASEAVHYNPSDMAGWIESMLGELNPGSLDPAAVYRQGIGAVAAPPTAAPFVDNRAPPQVISDPPLSDIDMALMEALQFSGTGTAQGEMGIPQSFPSESLHGLPVLPPAAKQSGVFPVVDGSSSSIAQWGTDGQQFSVRHAPTESAGDDGAQESGIRLVHLLIACAEAIQRNDLLLASDIVRKIRIMVRNPSGAMGKVASHFVEALSRRIYALNGPESSLGQADPQSEILYHHFYETCPYLKFAHFTANQAILEAVEGHERIHVIDFNLMHGLQWPALIQALALRSGGPPFLRLTGIGPRHPDGRDVLQEIGMKLLHLADSVNVEFEFRGVFADKLDDVKPWMLQLRSGEIVAVNSIFQLHRLLYSEPSGSSPIDVVLKSVRSLKPKIVTIVEQEANHNAPLFIDRFTESLHYYSTMFDSLEACNLPPHSTEKLLAELYIQKEICNIMACEGPFRVERHEHLAQWRMRLASAGFRPAHLGSNAFKQASMLLTLFSGEGFTVEENNGSLTLGWHSRPLISASAWQGFYQQ